MISINEGQHASTPEQRLNSMVPCYPAKLQLMLRKMLSALITSVSVAAEVPPSTQLA